MLSVKKVEILCYKLVAKKEVNTKFNSQKKGLSPGRVLLPSVFFIKIH